MVDIRRLNLERNPNKVVKPVDHRKFFLGEERLKTFGEALVELDKLPYWHPAYQAWEPFVTAYLTSGSNPDLALKWLTKFQQKITDFEPPACELSPMYEELLKMYRTRSCEAFPDYTWAEITEFVEKMSIFMDIEKQIYRELFKTNGYQQQLKDMLVKGPKEKYSPNLVYAVYLYRHGEMRDTQITTEITDELQNQLEAYTEDFTKAFKRVASFVDDTTDVYAWYGDNILRLITNAWKTTIDLSYKRNVITAADVFNMPVWLSEQITDYLNTLPCVMCVPVGGTYPLNALMYSMTGPGSKAEKPDPNNSWAYCLPRNSIKKMVDNVSEIWWEIRDGKFVSYLYARITAQAVNNTVDDGRCWTPSDYLENLRERGFPVGKDDGFIGDNLDNGPASHGTEHDKGETADSAEKETNGESDDGEGTVGILGV